jgi:hypothetical protein
MNLWLLFPTSVAVVYVGGQMFRLVFAGFDHYHASKREERLRAAASRNNGREQTGEKAG